MSIKYSAKCGNVTVTTNFEDAAPGPQSGFYKQWDNESKLPQCNPKKFSKLLLFFILFYCYFIHSFKCLVIFSLIISTWIFFQILWAICRHSYCEKWDRRCVCDVTVTGHYGPVEIQGCSLFLQCATFPLNKSVCLAEKPDNHKF